MAESDKLSASKRAKTPDKLFKKSTGSKRHKSNRKIAPSLPGEESDDDKDDFSDSGAAAVAPRIEGDLSVSNIEEGDAVAAAAAKKVPPPPRNALQINVGASTDHKDENENDNDDQLLADIARLSQVDVQRAKNPFLVTPTGSSPGSSSPFPGASRPGTSEGAAAAVVVGGGGGGAGPKFDPTLFGGPSLDSTGAATVTPAFQQHQHQHQHQQDQGGTNRKSKRDSKPGGPGLGLSESPSIDTVLLDSRLSPQKESMDADFGFTSEDDDVKVRKPGKASKKSLKKKQASPYAAAATVLSDSADEKIFVPRAEGKGVGAGVGVGAGSPSKRGAQSSSPSPSPSPSPAKELPPSTPEGGSSLRLPAGQAMAGSAAMALVAQAKNGASSDDDNSKKEIDPMDPTGSMRFATPSKFARKNPNLLMQQPSQVLQKILEQKEKEKELEAESKDGSNNCFSMLPLYFFGIFVYFIFLIVLIYF
jgi:hypothetical protein